MKNLKTVTLDKISTSTRKMSSTVYSDLAAFGRIEKREETKIASTIEAELATLHARIAQLEEAKKVPPPIITPQELLVKAKERVKNDQSRKNESPIATACRFAYRDQTHMLESIVESLNHIHSRLDALERK